MKKTFLLLIAIFAGCYLYAQTADDYIELVRSEFKADKKAVVNAKLALDIPLLEHQ